MAVHLKKKDAEVFVTAAIHNLSGKSKKNQICDKQKSIAQLYAMEKVMRMLHLPRFLSSAAGRDEKHLTFLMGDHGVSPRVFQHHAPLHRYLMDSTEPSASTTL